MAGLAAARKLSQTGRSVVVLEARQCAFEAGDVQTFAQRRGLDAGIFDHRRKQVTLLRWELERLERRGID